MTEIFKHYTPLVIGYGGNDGSLMEFIKNSNDIKEGIFWFYWEKEAGLNDKTKELIEKFNGYAVAIPGFYELFMQLGDKLGLELLGEKIVEIANQRTKNYQEQIHEIFKKDTTSAKTKDVVEDMITGGEKNWLYYEIEASKEIDIEKRNNIYKEGIENLPKSAELHGNYALFLDDIRNNYDQAEEFYKKAIELNPNNITIIGNHAKLLIIKRELTSAKDLIKKALQIDHNFGEKVELRLWFYRYAVFFAEYQEAQTHIEDLLAKGIKLVGWYLDNVLEVAKELNHPDYDNLSKLAKQITDID